MTTLTSNHNCNTCEKARKCKIAGTNDYPNLMPRPKRRCDVIGMCDKWVPIKRTVPLGAVVRGNHG